MSVVFIVRVSVTLNVTLSSPILRSNVTLPLWSSGSDVTLASRNVTFEAGDVTLGLLDADLNVTLPGERGCQSHSGPLAVKVDALRRRHGWRPFGHGSFLASPSSLHFSLSFRSLP
jgi:hypothetical protein